MQLVVVVMTREGHKVPPVRRDREWTPVAEEQIRMFARTGIVRANEDAGLRPL